MPLLPSIQHNICLGLGGRDPQKGTCNIDCFINGQRREPPPDGARYLELTGYLWQLIITQPDRALARSIGFCGYKPSLSGDYKSLRMQISLGALNPNLWKRHDQTIRFPPRVLAASFLELVQPVGICIITRARSNWLECKPGCIIPRALQASWNLGNGGAPNYHRLKYYCQKEKPMPMYSLRALWTDETQTANQFSAGEMAFHDVNGGNCTVDTDCSAIGDDVKYCQNIGKTVVISISGASGTIVFKSASEAQGFAQKGGNGKRSFGNGVVFDNADLDIENKNPLYWGDFTQKLRQLYATDSKKKYINIITSLLSLSPSSSPISLHLTCSKAHGWTLPSSNSTTILDIVSTVYPPSTTWLKANLAFKVAFLASQRGRIP
ncbi:hypothetical protein BC938DRAFT_481909 [Jimgerdemannia flammicorona]|uniref:GH18 domain-containing protein n=1 Tax=Jimgerdemannia flammicorona TaxID=994334 RepID=A0A433QF91_9FUNG|nr:hypothetical protein BC938DRAFT_481909 [Jimgerdemannia flammicorona]